MRCSPRLRPAMPPCRFCSEGERCVCSPRYYFFASMPPSSCAGDSCELHLETDMNDFGTSAGGEAPEFGPGGIGPMLSELGAVVAASVALGLAFSHSELAAELKSFSADALDLPPPRPVEPARQVVARYLDN